MNSFAYRSTYVPCALHQNFYVHTMFYWLINSRSYYKVQIEIGAAANQGVYIKIACKIQIYGFQLCTKWWLSEGSDYLSHGY